MSPAIRPNVAKAARRLTAPLRRFFNQHFAMVKSEVITSRDQVLAAGSELQRTAATVSGAADKIEDAAVFLSTRLGRLLERQDALGTALADFDARSSAALARVHGVAAATREDDALWCAFATRALHGLPEGSRILIAGDAGSVATVLVALGHTVAPGSAGGPADAVVGRDPATALGIASESLPAGGLLVTTGLTLTAPDPRTTIVSSVPVSDGVLTAARWS